jgi:hypothetical protein
VLHQEFAMTSTPTQAAILVAALQHLVTPPARLAPAPRDAIRKSLLAKGLIEPATLEVSDGNTAWMVNGVAAHYSLPKKGLGFAKETADTGTSAEARTTAPHAPRAYEDATLA